MQKRRSIRKIIQEPNAINHTSNIHRRQDNRNFTKTAHVGHPARIQVNTTLVNSAQVKPNAKVKYSNVLPIFNGETVYIIGGGPSLKNFDFRRLRGCKTIAINKAITFLPNADVLYWTDSRFYTWYKNEVDNYNGLKFTIKAGSQYTSDIQILKKGKSYGIEKDSETLAHGNNSGYASINLAYHLGAKRIILLGFDMANDGKDTHFHDGYPTKSTGDQIYRDKFLPGFTQLKSELDPEGVTVLNASVYSQLTTFTKITIEQALSFR